jgi:lipoprotein signal peptidase
LVIILWILTKTRLFYQYPLLKNHLKFDEERRMAKKQTHAKPVETSAVEPQVSETSIIAQTVAEIKALGSQPAILLFVSAAILLFLDQWTKQWAVETLYPTLQLPADPMDFRLYAKRIEVYSWWNYQLVGNKGAAWGIFGGLPDMIRLPFFTLIGFVAIIGIFLFYYKSYSSKIMRVSLIFIFGGALGNIMDRMTIGYVIDFIDWHYNGYHWPTFNVADIAISVGVGLMILEMMIDLFRPKMDENGAK